MQILIVTEKPSIARRISHILGKKVTKEKGMSKYTPIHRFKIDDDDITVTSVLGHIKTLDFMDEYNKWDKVDPESLFDAPTQYKINETNKEIPKVYKQLQTLGKDAEELIIATDADSEGEKIGYDIAAIIMEVNPDITVHRMIFSAVTKKDIEKAYNEASKTTLDSNIVEKVESRQEIDLRSGSAFTRFQTLGVRKVNPSRAPKIVSFGPCQTAALFFVVERHLERLAFVPEPFWYIHAQIKIGKVLYDLKWQKERLFDKKECKKIFDTLKKETRGRVEEVLTEEKKAYPPKPLNTVQFVSMAAKHLQIASERAMDIAERLYNAGIISYPRTETEIYPRTFSLKRLLEQHAEHPEWGKYASKLLQKRIRATRGKRDDKAHPPIHPTKSIEKDELDKLSELKKLDKNVVWAVYDMITRHFLATLSMPAVYLDTKIVVQIGPEMFNLTGKQIKDKGFLEIYPFRKIAEKSLPDLKVGDKVNISTLKMKEGKTQPPFLLTEAALIKLMDENGIGTDATIPNHITTNINRNYFKISGRGRTIQPTELGIALIKGLGNIDEMLVKPKLRAYIEEQTNLVAAGERDKDSVVKESSESMRKLFKEVVAKEETLINALAEAIEIERKKSSPKVELFDCPNCGNPIEIFKGKKGYYLRCTNPDKKKRTFYPLPAGIPRAAKFICPLCKKPIITMTSPKGNEYNLCPICWTEEIDTEEGKKQRGPCFNCEVEDCKGKTVKEKIKCPVCGEGALVTKRGKYGRFLACNRYPDCKTTIGLFSGDRVLKKVCECGWPIISKLSKQKKRYYKCANKECTVEIDYKEAMKSDSAFVKCPVCGKGELIERMGKYGKFIGCSNYPECKTTIALYEGDRPLKRACPKCGYVLISKLSKQKKRYYKCPNKECDYIEFPKVTAKTKTS
jgi:DNA topoisomerase I